MAEYRELQRSDLTAFDKEATTLVLSAMEEGWLGRMTSKGHALLLAPDGQTTTTVSRDSLRGRSGRNSKAAIERYRNSVPTPKPGPRKSLTQDVGEVLSEAMAEASPEEAPEAPHDFARKGGVETIEPKYVCQVCGEAFESAVSLGSHKRKHTLASRRREECPICGQRYSTMKMHLRVHGDEPYQAYVDGGMRGLRRWHRDQGEGKVSPERVERVDHGGAVAAVTELVQEVLDLREENAALREERDELSARIDLMKEALGL